MGLNVKQVYDANPSTTLSNNDLLYVGLSPYGLTDDSAIKYSDLYAQVGIAYQLTTLSGAFSLGQSGSQFKLTNGNSPSAGDTLYYSDVNGNHYFAAGGNFGGIFNVANPIAHFGFDFAVGQSYNDNFLLSASQSGTAVTGTGTNFSSGMVNGLIYWPSSTNVQLITAVNSTTSLTVSGSATQTNAPFVIYYGGLVYDPSSAFAFSPLLNVLINNIDTAPTVNRILKMGTTNAQLVEMGNDGIPVYLGNLLSTGLTYNSDLSQTASQSGFTVTGSGTSFNANMANGRIYWINTGDTANIISYNSPTSLTVDESLTEASQPFLIFYGGINSLGDGIFAITPFGKLLVNNIDADPTIKILKIGETADYINFATGQKIKITEVNDSTYTTLLTDYYITFNIEAPVSVTLVDNPPIGFTQVFKDSGGIASSSPITITPTSGTIDGLSSYTLNSNYQSVTLTYTSSSLWSAS